MSVSRQERAVDASGLTETVLSYAREDHSVTEALGAVLRARGWPVWWDRFIDGGVPYEEEILKHIQSSGCVLVLWSTHAARSRWVRAEAEEAANLERLIPVLLEEVSLPLGLRQLQSVSLVSWDGSEKHPDIKSLETAIRKMIGRSPPPVVARSRQVPRVVATAALAVIPLALAGLHYLPVTGGSLTLFASVSEVGFTAGPDRRLFRTALVVDTLRLTGISGFRVTWPGATAESTYSADRLDLIGNIRAGEVPPSITVNLLAVDEGTAVRTGTAGMGERFLSLTGEPQELEIVLDGPMLVAAADSLEKDAVFSGDRIIALVSAAEVTLFYTASSSHPTMGPLQVSGLSFDRLDRRREGENSEDQMVSTIQRGSFSLEDMDNRAVALRDGERLSVEGAQGNLRVDGSDTSTNVEFRGSASRIASAGWRTPSLLQILINRHLPIFIVSAMLYAAIVWTSYTAWRRRFR